MLKNRWNKATIILYLNIVTCVSRCRWLICSSLAWLPSALDARPTSVSSNPWLGLLCSISSFMWHIFLHCLPFIFRGAHPPLTNFQDTKYLYFSLFMGDILASCNILLGKFLDCLSVCSLGVVVRLAFWHIFPLREVGESVILKVPKHTAFPSAGSGSHLVWPYVTSSSRKYSWFIPLIMSYLHFLCSPVTELQLLSWISFSNFQFFLLFHIFMLYFYITFLHISLFWSSNPSVYFFNGSTYL